MSVVVVGACRVLGTDYSSFWVPLVHKRLLRNERPLDQVTFLHAVHFSVHVVKSAVVKFVIWPFTNQSNCLGQGHGTFCHVSQDLLSCCFAEVVVHLASHCCKSWLESIYPNLYLISVFASIYSSLNYYIYILKKYISLQHL